MIQLQPLPTAVCHVTCETNWTADYASGSSVRCVFIRERDSPHLCSGHWRVISVHVYVHAVSAVGKALLKLRLIDRRVAGVSSHRALGLIGFHHGLHLGHPRGRQSHLKSSRNKNHHADDHTNMVRLTVDAGPFDLRTELQDRLHSEVEIPLSCRLFTSGGPELSGATSRG